MKPALYIGTIAHQRFLPRPHRFQYPFFMWLLNIDEIDGMQDVGRWFSTRRFAMSRFHRPDYLGDPEQPLHASVKERMHELTGKAVTGQVFGLLNLRTFGLYFSPVNFYFGYDHYGVCSHFLAEVSNTPWNKRHHYAYDLENGDFDPTQIKQFHVSPFNPLDQQYQWHIEPPGKRIRIVIKVSDSRGQVFAAALQLARHPLTREQISRQLLKKPIMTASIIGGVYWQALKLYLKGVPYIPYQEEIS